ncbi:MAG: signal peptide peptidase SppA, partial [Proteobacteria bacterium]|nr:signal peptide peptidase SppA [Pseudomonadota bacterium]
LTPPARENIQTLLDNLMSQMKEEIAESRAIDPVYVKNIIDYAPYTGNEALSYKLIDKIGYFDELKYALKQTLPDTEAYLTPTAYLNRLEADSSPTTTIALVHVEGAISDNESGSFMGEMVAHSKTIIKALKQAVKDSSVKAIILRVNCPGGTANDSDLIRREVEKAVNKGKPVIVSVGNMAASGGYLVATHASKIVASPMSLIGSIGVFSYKLITQDFWAQYGIYWRSVQSGANAHFNSSSQDYDDFQQQKIRSQVDEIYNFFKEKVSQGRKLPLEVVQQLAKGRVYTGREAKEKGLIDVLGGLETAIEVAKQELALSAEDLVSIKVIPEEENFIEKLLSLVKDQDFSLSSWSIKSLNFLR